MKYVFKVLKKKPNFELFRFYIYILQKVINTCSFTLAKYENHTAA